MHGFCFTVTALSHFAVESFDQSFYRLRSRWVPKINYAKTGILES